MHCRYQYFLAGPEQDAALRQLLAETPMEGQISVSFLREPHYFDALPIEGSFSQVLAVQERGKPYLAGMGARSIKRCFVNGQVVPVGYLNHLRLHPAHRKSGLLGRGYRFLHALHLDGRAGIYLTTIADGNETATRTLTGQRATIPLYQPAGHICTFVFAPNSLACGQRLAAEQASVMIRPAREDDLPTVVDFWHREGSRYQCFPFYQASDFGARGGLLRGLEARDLLLAFRDNRLVGTLGLWDQSRFKQIVIDRYSGAMRWLRHLYNGYAGMRGRPTLPPPGSTLQPLTAAVPVVENGDPTVFEILLRGAARRMDPEKHPLLMAGCHESSPLLRVLKKIGGISYVTQLYIVCWPDGLHILKTLDGRPMYVELGAL